MSKLKSCNVKIFLAFALIMCILGLNAKEVYASTGYTDTESNNTAEQAQQISRNVMTYAQRVSGNTNLYRYVRGTLSGDDEDWYKVYLDSADDTYFDISGGTGYIFIDIYNSSLIKINTFTYLNNSTSTGHVFNVDALESGTYYIRLYHENINVNSSYYFTIGTPEYKLGTYTYNFSSITLNAKAQWEQQVNLASVDSIPNQAIGYKITVSGCTTSVSSKRYFYNEFYDSWVATKSGYYYNLPVTESSNLDQTWGIKYISTSTKNNTFAPQFTIDYVYPVLPD